ncbi:MAG: chemotaxis protein CheW [Desulfomonile tiedjei]|uniref:Chemotaxis protein CheA n=1 Tax=Desulfomonile tiedjei TaxID=2358 RepID=A0A9D6V0W0_9BACT|nr:chemotaxis protein CheW [Desulfomonile tiedjei]
MIDTEILQDYSSEARELLDEMENSLIRLEKEGTTPELLNNIFRAVHCIKGSAEYIGLERSSTLTHGVENLLDRMREGVLQLDSAILEFLFRAKDLILTLIAEVSEDHEEKTTISAMMSELEGFLQGTPRTALVVEATAEPSLEKISDPEPATEPHLPAELQEEEVLSTATEEAEDVSEADGVEFYEEFPEEEISPYEAGRFGSEEAQTATEEEMFGGEMDVLPEGYEDSPETVIRQEASEQVDEDLESSNADRTLDETIPLLLNISLYLDDLQDGFRPGEVISSLLQNLANLIDSMSSMGYSEAVDILESMEEEVNAIEEDRESLSPEEIDSLRAILYSLRSFYPEDLFLPLKKSLERSEEAASGAALPEMPALAPELSAFALELKKAPGISMEAVAEIERAGFSSIQQLSQADAATLLRIPSVSPEIVDSILRFAGATVNPVKQHTQAPGTKGSLLADVDDELLSEFEGMFSRDEDLGAGAIDQLYPYGQKAGDILSELGSIGEDSDREVIEIFLAYGWEILDKLRPYVITIQNRQASPADLESCAELIKSIRSSSTYMDYQSLASFLDEWYERTVWSAQKMDSLSPRDLAFMEDSLSRFQDFLGGLEMALHPQAAPPVPEPLPAPRPAAQPMPEFETTIEVMPSTLADASDSLVVPAQDEVHLQENPTGEIESVTAPVTTAEYEQSSQAETAVPQPSRDSQEGPVVKTMRVDSAKVDVLLNQVGELVVNRSYVEQLALELKNFQRALSTRGEVGKREIQAIKDLTLKVGEASISLGRVATDIQEGVMKLRMLPVGQLFNRMPRLIRDLSRRVGKTVELNVHGGDTEVDKRVIEQIYNPLVHLIRNAVDHGIEGKAARKKQGKREEGTVTLSAYSQGNQVVIDVEDDGRGIDTQAVIEKAVENRLLDAQDAKSVSPQDAYNLLFVPGFSTSKKVTRTSGRGVGMDVVKKDVEKINGHVEVESRENYGTRISIKIPLTLAIIQTLLIRSNKHVFAIPLTSVREIIQVAPHEITTIEGFEVIKFRDETIPVLRINEIFKLKQPSETTGPKFLVLTTAGLKSVGFLVEDLIGEQDVVIKPLADHVFKSRGLAGSTILGDGTIALVLDVLEVIEDVIARQRQLSQTHQGMRYAKTEQQATDYSTMDL